MSVVNNWHTLFKGIHLLMKKYCIDVNNKFDTSNIIKPVCIHSWCTPIMYNLMFYKCWLLFHCKICHLQWMQQIGAQMNSNPFYIYHCIIICVMLFMLPFLHIKNLNPRYYKRCIFIIIQIKLLNWFSIWKICSLSVYFRVTARTTISVLGPINIHHGTYEVSLEVFSTFFKGKVSQKE